MNQHSFDISNRTIFRILTMILAFCVAVFLIVVLRQQLIWVGVSFFFALALEPPVNWLANLLPKKSRGLAVLLVITVTISILALVIALFGPSIVKQFQELVRNLPNYYHDFLNQNNPISNYLKNNPRPTFFNGGFSNALTAVGNNAVSILGNIFNSIFAVLTIIVFTFFMVLEWPRWQEIFWRYQDPIKRVHRKQLYHQMTKTVSGYVNGNLLTSLVAGVTAAIFLTLIRVPYAAAFGLLVAVLDLIPMLGATLAAILVCAFVLLFGGVNSTIITAVFFIIYQQIENNLLQPMIFSKTVKISPLVAGIAALFGAILAGLIGALVAIPVAASLQILVKDYLDRKYPQTKLKTKK